MLSRRYRWFLGLAGASLLLACGRQPVASPAGRFASAPPLIDGQASEWTDSLRYDPASKLQYQVLNDRRAVYVRLKAADPTTQARLLRLGFVVWLDTTGRHQQQFGVRFPLGGEAGVGGPRADEPAPPAGGERPDRRARLRQVLANLHEMELLHYKDSPEPVLTDLQSPLGVKLAVGLDEQEDLIYELAVPLRLLYHHLPALSTGPPAVIGLTLIGNSRLAPTGSAGSSGGLEGGRGMGMRGGGGDAQRGRWNARGLRRQ